jgi:hypothetical protein
MAERLPTAARLTVAAACAWIVAVWVTHRVVGGDTPWLVDGTDQLVRCLSAGDLVKCGYTGELTSTGQTTTIGPYPLFQYLPDALARSLGATHHSRYTVLALLSVAAVVVGMLVAWIVLARLGKSVWIWALLAIVLSGPILAYANTTWGEMLATALLVFLVAAAVLPASAPILGVAAFFACLTKESSYPFVAALGLLGLLLVRRRTGRPMRMHALAGALGIAAAFVCASLFNVLRFGSIRNTNYLRDEFTTPLRHVPELAVGLYAAPNGGIVIFWTSASVLLAALLLLPFARGSQTSNGVFQRRFSMALVGIVLGLTLLLASWYSPFGWVAWGPRLSLPWVLPLLLLGLVALEEPLADLTRRSLAPNTRFILIGLAVVAVALPHVGYLWRQETKDEFFALSSENPRCTGQPGSSDYYACMHETMWSRRPIVNDALRGLAEPGGAVTAVAVAAGIFGSLFLLRTGLNARAGAVPA